jgi:leucyl aminopeptidase (aminopeptidase T)
MTVPGFTVERAATMAKNVLRGSLRLKKGESVTIETWTDCLPWASAFALEARKMGVRPLILYEDEAGYWEAVKANPKALGAASAPEWAALAKSDAYVFFHGPADVPRFRALPEKVRNSVTAYNSDWYARAAKAKVRGIRLMLGQVSEATARSAEVPVDVWREELIKGALVDPTPMQKEADRLASRLKTGRQIEITAPSGTSLKLRLRGRTPVPGGGIITPVMERVGFNIITAPAGWVSVAVDEKFAEGTMSSSTAEPSMESPAHGGVWTFTGGRLTDFSYTTGEQKVRKEFQKAPVGKDRPGVLTIGLNPALDISPILQDQARGTITLGVGANGFFGGSTKIPFTMWSCVRGGTLSLDGKPLVRDGRVL